MQRRGGGLAALRHPPPSGWMAERGKNFVFHKFFDYSSDACAGVGMGVERGGGR